jgi:cell division protein FtsB
MKEDLAAHKKRLKEIKRKHAELKEEHEVLRDEHGYVDALCVRVPRSSSASAVLGRAQSAFFPERVQQ